MIVINCQLIQTIQNWTHRCLLRRLNLCLLQQSDTDHGVWPYLIGQSLPDWSLLYRTHVQEWDIPTSANCMPNCNLTCPFGKHISRSSRRVKFTARLEQLFGPSWAFLRSGILGSGWSSKQGSWRTHALSLNLSANLAPAVRRLRRGRLREWSHPSGSLQICPWLRQDLILQPESDILVCLSVWMLRIWGIFVATPNHFSTIRRNSLKPEIYFSIHHTQIMSSLPKYVVTWCNTHTQKKGDWGYSWMKVFASGPEDLSFFPRNPHDRRTGRREVTPADCPLTLLCTIQHTTHTRTHTHTIM